MPPARELVPAHLQRYVAHQDATLYSAIDHASWRFILRISKAFFAKHAHASYLDGLEETGISVERIPLITEMDARLRRVGWRAVPVNGFIPPQVFMEFQSLGFLPIACEMRTLEHLAYTPAPDIVHEAAGHAPIIANPEYAAYLRSYGSVARKAIYSRGDLEVYQAIRHLSDIKELPHSSPTEIANAEHALIDATERNQRVSEAARLSRMNWWTVEYGLVGELASPKIYGAGLLSSVGESANCLSPEVKKLPLTIDCVGVSYDITRPQPQLFVTPSFEHLSVVLEELASTLAFRTGGQAALAEARAAKALSTTTLGSGLEVSGVLESWIEEGGEVCFAKWSGPVQLAQAGAQLAGHGPLRHALGFSTPLGVERVSGRALSDWTEQDLAGRARGDGTIELKFGAGIEVRGRLAHEPKAILHGGRLRVFTLNECTIRRGEEWLYRPEWGSCDLACGASVSSVYGDAADRAAYTTELDRLAEQRGEPTMTVPPARASTHAMQPEYRAMDALYRTVREVREAGHGATPQVLEALEHVASKLETLPSSSWQWLLRLELIELNQSWHLRAPWVEQQRAALARVRSEQPQLGALIERGLALL